MALEAAFANLNAKLGLLHDCLTRLRVTVVEDRPRTESLALVDLLGDAADDLVDGLRETFPAAVEAQRAVAHPTDLDRARRALSTCQELFSNVSRNLVSGLASYERLTDLASLGKERGGEWSSWVLEVRKAVERCRQPLFDVDQALILCWQEIAEKVGITSVAMHATNIGQQVSVPERRPRGHKGIT